MFHGLELMFHHLLGITSAIGKLSNLPFLLGVLTQLAPYLASTSAASSLPGRSASGSRRL
jgi:hypothetical protein